MWFLILSDLFLSILPRFFLDFQFSRKVLREQVTTVAFSRVSIENLNFKGMFALPLTPYPTLNWPPGHDSLRVNVQQRGVELRFLFEQRIETEPNAAFPLQGAEQIGSQRCGREGAV